MEKLRLPLCFLIIAACLFAFQPFAQAQQPAASTPAATNESKNAASPASPLPIAPLATQLGQTLQTLVESAAAPVSDEELSGQITDTFATGLLNTIAKAVDELKANSAPLTNYASAWPDFKEWLDHQVDPHRIALWNAIGQDLLIIVGTPLLFGLAAMLFLIPLRLKLKRNKPQTMPGRMGLLVGLFLLRLVPVFIFLGAALLLLEQNETHRLPRFVILNVIYAVSLGYIVQQVLRGVFAPTTPHLRPLQLTTAQAVTAYRWLSSFTFIIVYSYFLIDVATALRIPANAIALFQNFFALILTVMAIVVIFQARARVAAILRGPAEKEETSGFGHTLRTWLARHWHGLATVYLMISLAVTVMGVQNGLALMLRGTILSIILLIAARFGFIVLEKWKTPKINSPAPAHRQILAFLFRPILWAAAVLGFAEIWGVRVGSFIATPPGQRVFGAVLSITVTLLVLTVLYEVLSAWIERHLNRRDKHSKQPVASARARTLLPMVRNSVFILFSAIAVLICLSALGFNTAPLLAGAGVVGVAIGFGSQTLVKDFLTGLFIVAENTIAVGDIVKIDSFSGTVEALSIRTIRLRDVDGALHILPFSEVLKITNMTRGFAYALVDIGVAYDTDLDRAMEIMRGVGASLQEDPLFKRVILEPIEVMGVEALGDFSITLRARIRTRPGKQGDVRRLLLLRIKQSFDKEHIDIPFPTAKQIVYMENPTSTRQEVAD